MTEKQKDDIYYVCSLIEFIARKTKNHRQDVIGYFSKKDIQRQLRLAEVNHCLSFIDVFSSFITDEISDFNSSVYYTNPDYLRCSYLSGEMLA